MQTNLLPFLAGILLLTGSCRKDTGNDRCDDLKTALAAADKPAAAAIINMLIAKGPARYTEANLTALTTELARCGINTAALCFDCIKTLPSQSELRLLFANNGQAVQMTIDISYTLEGRMQFVNLHP